MKPFDHESHRSISRRALILSGGAAVGTAAMYLASGETAWADGTDVVIETISDDDVHFLSSNPFTLLSFPRQLGLRLLNKGPAIPAGTNFQFSFDTRFYNLAPVALLSLAGDPVTDFALSPPKRTTTGATTWSLTVNIPIPPTATPAEALTVTLGNAKSHLYPYDMLRAPQTLRTAPSNRRASGRFTSRYTLNRGSRALTAGLPWGVQTSAFWDRKAWGTDGRYIYFFPSQVTLTSVGPATTPHPPEFSIAVDPQIVKSFSVSFLRLNNAKITASVHLVRSTRTNSVFETTWRVPAVLHPDDVLEVGFTADVITPSGALETIKHPVIRLDSTARDPRQRVTDPTSVTRLDSIWM